MEVVVRIASAGATGQDRAAAFAFGGGQLLVVADGAGGVSGGAEAAQAVIDHLLALDSSQVHDWVEVLRWLDRVISSAAAHGETTAVVAFVTDEAIVGPSVGDSGGWMLSGVWLDLVEGQRRKPLLGTGVAVRTGFGPFPMGQRVLLGSDGLFKYVDARKIGDLARGSSLHDAAASLIQAARLPSGTLQDDVAVVITGSSGCAAEQRSGPSERTCYAGPIIPWHCPTRSSWWTGQDLSSERGQKHSRVSKAW